MSEVKNKTAFFLPADWQCQFIEAENVTARSK